MATPFECDNYDHKILALLQQNARLSFTELGRRVHLTSPAVAERVKRLEEAGIIQGYGLRLNLQAYGYSFEAMVQVKVERHDALDAWVFRHPEVLASHATTGEYCAILHIALTSPQHLHQLLSELAELGQTSTAMILQSLAHERQRIAGSQLPEVASRRL